MDDFLLRALAGGAGVALAAGPLGCFVLWRRMAYFGAALSHSALLGIAAGFLLGVSLTAGIFVFCLLMAALLALLERERALATDTLLGILAHAALALGLVAIAFLEGLRVDLLGYLFGDILAVSRHDLYLIYATAVGSLLVLWRIWRPLLSLTVNEDLAAAEGVPVPAVRLAFVLMMASVIAVGMKVVGLLLIVSLLIIPAAAARRFSATPEGMAAVAALAGVVSVALGLLASLHWDVPSGPAIVVMATLLFAASLCWPGRRAPAAQA